MNPQWKVYKCWANRDAEHREWLGTFARKEDADDFSRMKGEQLPGGPLNPQSVFIVDKAIPTSNKERD